MSTRRTLAASAVAALAASVIGLSGLTAMAGAPSAAGATPGGPLRYGVHFSPFFLLDFGRHGVHPVTDLSTARPSKGDQTVFRDTVMSDGQPVGRDGGTCTVVAIDPQAADPVELSCTVTFDLPGGRLTTQGLAGTAPVKDLVVTGGTGDFAGAEGTATIVEHGPRHGRLVVRVH